MNNIKLNVGPSPVWKKEGWVTLDHKLSRVDQKAILGDADNIPLENSTCETVFCSHVIEHIPNYKFEKVLLEFNRVLKKDGIVRILSPDLFLLAKSYIVSDKDTPPGWLNTSSRAALLTPSPYKFVPSTITSPTLRPIRNCICESSETERLRLYNKPV